MHVLPLEKRAENIEHLMEGVRLRPASRLCGVSRVSPNSVKNRGANIIGDLSH